MKKTFDEKMGAGLWVGRHCVAALGLNDDLENYTDLEDSGVRRLLEDILRENGLKENGKGGWVRD